MGRIDACIHSQQTLHKLKVAPLGTEGLPSVSVQMGALVQSHTFSCICLETEGAAGGVCRDDADAFYSLKILYDHPFTESIGHRGYS